MHVSNSEVYALVAKRFSAVGLAESLCGTPIVTNADDPAHPELTNGYFTYTKLWLRTYAPVASVDLLEMEINVRLALTIPVAFAGLASTRLLANETLSHLSLRGQVIMVALLNTAAIALAMFVFWRGLRLRRLERIDSLTNYVAAWHILRLRPQEQVVANDAALAHRANTLPKPDRTPDPTA